MKAVVFIAASVALTSFIACKSGRAYNPDTTIESSQATQQPTDLTTQTAVNSSQPANPAVLPVSSAQPVVKLNPAHGQPGHRCDVAEGAPLPAEYKPTTPVTTTAQTQPGSITSTPVQMSPANTQPVQQPAATTTQKAAPGMNPAHGQPGHRCDIAVGAPLNSKPAATTPATTTPSTSTNTTAGKPVVLNQTSTVAAPQKVAPGMNPAHGQPGHRCDLAVGAPLNSKPAAATTGQQVSPLQPMPVTPIMPGATNATPVKPKPDSSGKQ